MGPQWRFNSNLIWHFFTNMVKIPEHPWYGINIIIFEIRPKCTPKGMHENGCFQFWKFCLKVVQILRKSPKNEVSAVKRQSLSLPVQILQKSPKNEVSAVIRQSHSLPVQICQKLAAGEGTNWFKACNYALICDQRLCPTNKWVLRINPY